MGQLGRWDDGTLSLRAGQEWCVPVSHCRAHSVPSGAWLEWSSVFWFSFCAGLIIGVRAGSLRAFDWRGFLVSAFFSRADLKIAAGRSLQAHN